MDVHAAQSAEPPGWEAQPQFETVRIGGQEFRRVVVHFELPGQNDITTAAIESIKKDLSATVLSIGTNGHTQRVGMQDNIILHPPAQPDADRLHAFSAVLIPPQYFDEIRAKLERFCAELDAQHPDINWKGLIESHNKAILSILAEEAKARAAGGQALNQSAA